MQIDIYFVLFLIVIPMLLIVALIFIASLALYNWHRRKSRPTQLLRPKTQLVQSKEHLSQPKHVATPIYLDKEDTKPIKIVLGEIDDPLGEIMRYQKREMDSYEEIQIDKRALIGISGWFQQAPNLVQSGAQMALNTYTLTFKPEVAKGLADGSLKIMESMDGGIRAIAVDGKNVIQGAGSLNLARGLKSIASVAAVWQVLATVTSQKFLIDINKQLVQVDKKLKDIKTLLDNQQYTKLIGNLKYIGEFRDILNSQSFENLEVGVFLNKLEDIERECNQIMSALEREMELVHVASTEQPLGANFNIEDNFIEFKNLINNYERLAQSYLIAVAVKCLAYQTRLALPSNHDLTLKRLSTLQTELSTWDEDQQKFFQLVGKRVPELNSWIDDGKDEQRQLRRAINERKDSLTKLGQDIQKLVVETENNIRHQLQEISQPLTLLVELNKDGQIIKTWKLNSENNKPVDIIEEAPLENEQNQNNICPDCGLPFKTPELVEEHRERWGH